MEWVWVPNVWLGAVGEVEINGEPERLPIGKGLGRPCVAEMRLDDRDLLISVQLSELCYNVSERHNLLTSPVAVLDGTCLRNCVLITL